MHLVIRSGDVGLYLHHQGSQAQINRLISTLSDQGIPERLEIEVQPETVEEWQRWIAREEGTP